MFGCLYPRAFAYAWGLNGEFLPGDQFPPDVILTLPSVDSPAKLIIPAIPQYNNTVVQCGALEIGKVVISCSVLLQVQGQVVSSVYSTVLFMH